eukprot:scaffold114181_cov40-Tisochrysis_lutea.AAC.1
MFARILSRRIAAATAPVAAGAIYTRSQPLLAKEKQHAAGQSQLVASPAEEGELSMVHRLLNFIADNPFKTVIGTAVPMYLAIFAHESTAEATRNMPFSQRLIHTRVYGQVGIVAVRKGL